MKTLASFVGRVQSVGEKTATVLLANQSTGERVESQCDTDVLRENGIGAGDEFRCEVVRFRGTTSTVLTRLAPKAFTLSQAKEIRASFAGRWDF